MSVSLVRRRRVLVVDDDLRVILAITRILSRDYEVSAVESASAALELFDGGVRFDVVLCDVNMPGTSGADLFRTLERVYPEIARRLVFLTAFAFDAGVRAFLDGVENDRLEKPFRVRELRQLVGKVAGSKQ